MLGFLGGLVLEQFIWVLLITFIHFSDEDVPDQRDWL